MKKRIRLSESRFKQLVLETAKQMLREQQDGFDNKENLNKYVPNRCFKTLEKLNNELENFRQRCGEDFPTLLDTSAGTECFFEIVELPTINNGVLTWKENETFGGTHTEEWNLVRYDDEEGYWFDNDDFKDQIGYLRSCMKKALKYFEEYDPAFDEDEEKRNSFLNGLDD